METLKIKIFIYFVILLLIIIWFYSLKNIKDEFSLDRRYKSFIKDCFRLKLYNNSKIQKAKNLYFSVCLPVYNMEKYIAKTLLSIINQSFKNFEIIIVNDNSNDKTVEIIKNYNLNDERIKIINHLRNLGVYKSRIDGILKAEGKYILLMDPDDFLLNSNLLEDLYKYNINFNIDIIEFSVYYKKDRMNQIYFPKLSSQNHFHNYKKKIIYQPELSNIIYHYSNSKKYSPIQCRTVWNKIVRKNIIFKTIHYLNKLFYNNFWLTADDTPINIINFELAKNYSNLKLPGYLYILRNNSASRIGNNEQKNLIICNNHLLYYTFLYHYIKDFNKNIQILLYELKANNKYIIMLKNYKSNYKAKAIKFLTKIIKENINKEFKLILYDIISKLKNSN